MIVCIQHRIQAGSGNSPHQIKEILKGTYQIQTNSLILYHNNKKLNDLQPLSKQGYNQGDPLDGKYEAIPQGSNDKLIILQKQNSEPNPSHVQNNQGLLQFTPIQQAEFLKFQEEINALRKQLKECQEQVTSLNDKLKNQAIINQQDKSELDWIKGQLAQEQAFKKEMKDKIQILQNNRSTWATNATVNQSITLQSTEIVNQLQVDQFQQESFIEIINTLNSHIKQNEFQTQLIQPPSESNIILSQFEYQKRQINELEYTIAVVGKASKQNIEMIQETQQQFQGPIEVITKLGKAPFGIGIATVQTEFRVHKPEIKEGILESINNLLNNIKLPEDYKSILYVPAWKIIRTYSPQAYGQHKSVFLMHKCDQKDELYVLKMPPDGHPYKTYNEALINCQTHQIAKYLMEKFIKKLKEAVSNKNSPMRIPSLQYSNILIFQESQNQYWIGECLPKGDFFKYNNSYGYISGEYNMLNQLAQAFSYYTYHMSELNYIITDVQGVGLHFTDPTIHTQKGKYDRNDNGYEGIQQYIAALDMNKDICREILLLLNIEIK